MGNSAKCRPYEGFASFEKEQKDKSRGDMQVAKLFQVELNLIKQGGKKMLFHIKLFQVTLNGSESLGLNATALVSISNIELELG